MQLLSSIFVLCLCLIVSFQYSFTCNSSPIITLGIHPYSSLTRLIPVRTPSLSVPFLHQLVSPHSIGEIPHSQMCRMSPWFQSIFLLNRMRETFTYWHRQISIRTSIFPHDFPYLQPASNIPQSFPRTKKKRRIRKKIIHTPPQSRPLPHHILNRPLVHQLRIIPHIVKNRR